MYLKISQATSSLKERDFFFLWVGIIALMSGVQMQMLVRGYHVYELEDSGTLLGLVNAGAAMPMLAFSLFGGVIADRLNRKRIIQIGQFCSFAISFSVFILIESGFVHWSHLLIAAILQGGIFAFMMPARQALIPQLVGKSLVSNALALNAAAMSATTLAAPALAGILYGTIGPGKVYFLISILSLLAAALTLFIRHSGEIGNNSVKSRKTEPSSVFRDIKEGFEYLRGRRLIQILLIMALATTLLAMPFRFLMPIFIVDIYQLGADSMGLLVAIMGAGSLIGALYIAAKGNKNRGILLLWGTLLSGISLLFVSLVPFYYFAAIMMIPLGLGDASRRTINMALVMEITDDEFRGRVMSIFQLNFGLMPLGILPAGIAADVFGGQFVIGILAVALIVFTGWVWVLRPEVRVTQ